MLATTKQFEQEKEKRLETTVWNKHFSPPPSHGFAVWGAVYVFVVDNIHTKRTRIHASAHTHTHTVEASVASFAKQRRGEAGAAGKRETHQEATNDGRTGLLLLLSGCMRLSVCMRVCVSVCLFVPIRVSLSVLPHLVVRLSFCSSHAFYP